MPHKHDTHAAWGQLDFNGNDTTQDMAASSAWSQVANFDNASNDPKGYVSAAAGSDDEITVNESGWYRVAYSIDIDGDNGETCTVDLRKNGTASAGSIAGTERSAEAATGDLITNVSAEKIVYLESGDVISLWAKGGSGGETIVFPDGTLIVHGIG
jgi:hypothetical protein